MIDTWEHTQESEAHNFIIENEIATDDEVSLVTSICGYNMEALNGIIYSRTGYHDIEQLFDCEKDAFYFNDQVKSLFNLADEEEE